MLVCSVVGLHFAEIRPSNKIKNFCLLYNYISKCSRTESTPCITASTHRYYTFNKICTQFFIKLVRILMYTIFGQFIFCCGRFDPEVLGLWTRIAYVENRNHHSTECCVKWSNILKAIVLRTCRFIVYRAPIYAS